MHKQAQDALTAYGWFGVLAGAAMLAVAVKQGVNAADGEALVATVTGIVALFLILVGWMMLTLESRERTGRWPQWGMLHIWPSIGLFVGFLAISTMLFAVVKYLGGAMEHLMLAAIPADVPARDILAMSGYISGGVWLVFNLPTVALRLAHSARGYSATLERDAASGTMSPV